ncbi:MAG TPA: GNAT family N-acetyltransferase [Anaerolineae bacterium]|nr:GNAT family N-acetyltransferase [Anaerolineae bacterium]HQI83854.1 GNAT family N-acetyltransferase [Anaerolineae bacterium]
MDIPCITTERLVLHAFSEQDVDPLFDILQQPGILRYYPRPDPPPRETVERIATRQLAHWEEHGYGWWAVEFRDDPRLLGWAGLTYLPETGETEVAYLLRQEVWRRGLATEAAKAALRFGFERFAFPFIIGLTHPENIASQRVLEKSGLQFVEKAVYFGMDCYRYVIRRDENGSLNGFNEI